MSRLLTLLTLLLLLMAGAAVVIVTRVNPDRFAPQFVAAVAARTGMQLEIGGDLALALRPAVQIVAEDLRLRHPDASSELASVARLSLAVDPWALLRSEVVIRAWSLEGLHLNLQRSADGTANWQPVTGETAAAGADLPDLPMLTLRNASMDVQDLRTGVRRSLRNLDLSARDVNAVAREFAAEARFDWLDAGTGSARLVQYQGRLALDLAEGELDLTRVSLTLTPLQWQGEAQIRDLFSNPSLSGRLSTTPFDLPLALENLGWLAAPAGRDMNLPDLAFAPHQQASIEVTFNADNRQVRIPNLQLTLGAIAATGEFTLRRRDGLIPTTISYALRAGEVDLTPWLSADPQPDTAGAAPDPAADPAAPAPIPLLQRFDWRVPRLGMSDLTVQGDINIETLRMGTVETGRVGIFTYLEDGVLDLETQPVAVIGGTLEGALRFDSRPSASTAMLRINGAGLDMSDLALPGLPRSSMQGRLSLGGEWQAVGERPEDWWNTVTGGLAVRVDGAQLGIGLLRQIFTAISALSPSGETLPVWPDTMGFASIEGLVNTRRGLADQHLRLRLDNLDIRGDGGLDLAENRFAFHTVFTLLPPPEPQTLAASASYLSVPWPVPCEAALDALISQYCRPDFNQVRSLFSRTGTPTAVPTDVGDPPPVLPPGARALVPRLLPPDPTPAVPVLP